MSEFINRGLANLEPEWVRFAIVNNIDLSTYFFQKFNLENPAVKPLAKWVLRSYWDEIDKYLSNVTNVYMILSRNPKIKKLLDTKKGRKWLNENVIRLYYALYDYIQ